MNLWSYPSPYRDQKQGGKGDGKELCDLLVVCGQHVLIFSEKTIAWPNGDLQTAWVRWSKRAIKDSAKQTKGTERWISEFPERIFLDRNCTTPFPIDLPKNESRKVHRILVANGCAEACRKHMAQSSGSLIINPQIVGSSHWNNSIKESQPFMVGDVDPSGSFIHVFNETALDIIMSELDTIVDFTDYLIKKEEFIRSGLLSKAYGEENLVAYYGTRINKNGDHDFTLENKKTPIEIGTNEYRNLVRNTQYLAKKNADKISYTWDRLIHAFTNHMLGGTSITLKGYDFELRKNEIGVRHMALVPRFLRRSLAEGVMDALRIGKESNRFFRALMGPAGTKNDETAFFIQTMKYLDWMEEKQGYEGYRILRTEYARICAQGLLEKYAHLKRVIGISVEPPDQGRGTSEDLIYAEQAEWTDEERENIRKDCQTLGVLQNVTEKRWDGQEFPVVTTITIGQPNPPPTAPYLNRKQRRAQRSRARQKPT